MNATTALNASGKQPLPPPTPHGVFGWLRFSLSFAIIIKALCMMSNILFQASPLPAAKQFMEMGDTGDTDSAPFISIAYGSSQWCFYGLFAFIVTGKSGFLVLVYSNIVGACLGIFYVFTFQRNCKNEEVMYMSNMYFRVLGTLVGVQLICMGVLPAVRALFISGLISSAWSIIGSLSLMTTVPTVLKTRDARSLPFPLLVAAEASALIWITCGVMLRDPWITVPNVTSAITCGLALGLVWHYPGKEEGLPTDTTMIASEDGTCGQNNTRRQYGTMDGTPTEKSSCCVGGGSMGGTGETY